jgi:hypothetical protein
MDNCKHRLHHAIGEECECVPPYIVLTCFVAWLTTRKIPITLSRVNSASEAVELVGEFCKSQGWKTASNDFTGDWFGKWFRTIKPYPKG